MNIHSSEAILQQKLNAAKETIQALSKRMRQLERHQAELPFQQQLQSYQACIAEKSKALQKVEDWSKLIVESSMDAIIRLDHHGCIQSWSPAAERMFGYHEDDILGLVLEDTLLPKRLHHDEFGHFYHHLKQGMNTLMHQRLEGIAQCLDGSELAVEFVISVIEKDREFGFIMVLSDISQRKKAELALRHSHENLQALVAERTTEVADLAAIIQSTLNFVGMMDTSGHILYVNAAGLDMIGLEHDAPMTDMTVADFHSELESRRIIEDILPETIQTGALTTECLFMHTDGTEIFTSSVFMALFNAEGKPEKYAVVARNLNMERALQKQVEHVDRLESLGVLAGGIAHDFNNILTAIIGNTGMAQRKLDTYSPAQKYLHNIETSSLQAANLCRQMLAYSGKGSFIIQPLQLSRLIGEMEALLKVSIDKNVVLHFDLHEALPNVEADITQIQQIIMNLVINASEAINKHSGVISIATGTMEVDDIYLQRSIHQPSIKTGTFVYLEVSDSGSGMDVKTQKKIFDPFFTTKFTGRGLGMSAVLGIVHGHHGLLNIYSELNKGTTFKIAFPICTSSEVLDVEPDNINLPRQNSGVILVIDDEETIRELASIVLQDRGFEVLLAVDGKDGVDVFRQHQDNITGVLLDMTMPRMNGEDCYTELRKINPTIKVILSSGYSEEDAMKRFRGKGLVGFIQKPYLIDAFQEAVEKYLR